VVARRIGISLLAYEPLRIGGAGIFAAGVTRALVARKQHEYVLFVPSAYEHYWRSALAEEVAIVTCGPDPRHRALRVLFEQWRLPVTASRLGVSKIFFPIASAPVWRRPRSVITIIDLLLLSRATDFPLQKRMYLRWAYRQIARRAYHIVTISEFCRRDIGEKLGVQLGSITVASPGVDHEFLAAGSARVGLELSLPDSYLLSVAGAYPHKQLSRLIDAFRLIAGEDPDLHLVLAGTHTGSASSVAGLRLHAAAGGIASRVVFLPPLSRDRMPELFARARALVSSSEFEGFGIPILEAMAMGCPVAAAPAEAVVEVLGGCGWIARDFTAEALAEVIRQALDDAMEDVDRVERARQRAASVYSWDAAAAALEGCFAVP
jgi:glycosyltransferase involved in cell wall biosynthesis